MNSISTLLSYVFKSRSTMRIVVILQSGAAFFMRLFMNQQYRKLCLLVVLLLLKMICHFGLQPDSASI